MSAGLLAETTRRVDEIVARTQAQGGAPSVVAAVLHNGCMAHFRGAGELPAPDPDTQYRIGSLTKSLTAALMLQLRDEGRLALDDPLDEHLPGTSVGSVRLRQLLGHVAGLQREPDGHWWERHAGSTLDALLAGVTPGKLSWAPYRTYHYSNLAYGLLGAVVRRVSGSTWSDAVSTRLLAPLGMSRTTDAPREPFARGYVVHPWHGTLHEEPRHDAGAMAPAGQLWSTAADMVTWAAFLADPDPAVLSSASVAEMAAPVVIADPENWTSGYGLGLQLWRQGERVFVGHTGSMPGYLAVLAVHRPSRTAAIAFANAYSLRGTTIGGLGQSILEAVLDGEPAPPPRVWRPGLAPPAEVEPLCGPWWWMGREFEARWDSDAAELIIAGRRAGAEEWRFVREAPDRWRGLSGENDGEVLQVLRDRAGAVRALDIATFVFTRAPMLLD